LARQGVGNGVGWPAKKKLVTAFLIDLAAPKK